jgi:hypothetical protein
VLQVILGNEELTWEYSGSSSPGRISCSFPFPFLFPGACSSLSSIFFISFKPILDLNQERNIWMEWLESVDLT